MNKFDKLELFPPDPIMGLSSIYRQDDRKNKVNLGVGVYNSPDGKIALFESVQKAEKFLCDEKKSKGYPPIDGDLSFRELASKLILPDFDPKTYVCAQTVGCTLALRTTGEILNLMGVKCIYIPNLTWPNHNLLYSSSGLKVKTYNYYHFDNHTLAFKDILETLETMSSDAAILLQVSCHNPTGRDPTKDQWREIAEIIKKRNLCLILDSSYHGLGQDLQKDIWPIHLFMKELSQFFIGYSFAKNFGIYGERTGVVIGVDNTKKTIDQLRSNIKHQIRGMTSTPAIHGSNIVKTVLESDELKNLWKDELKKARTHLHELRSHFVECLKKQNLSINYDFILHDNGLFSLMGLNKNQILKLRDEYAIYIIENSRLNIAALSLNNMGYVAESIKKVL